MIRLYFSFIILTAAFSQASWASSQRDSPAREYVVTVTGQRKIMDYAKTRSEIKTLESAKLCPPRQILLKAKNWKCRNKKNDRQTCINKFHCQETPSNFEQLKQAKRARIQNYFHRQPLSYNALLFYKNNQGALKKAPLVSSSSPDLVIEQYDETAAKQIKKKNKRNKHIERSRSKRSWSGKEEKASSSLRLLSFSGSVLFISDEQENSIYTTQLAWNPSYHFSNNWMLGLQAGAHLFNETKVNETESFLITEFGGSLGKTLYKNFYLKVGAGIQNWQNEQAQSYQYQSFSLGYLFQKPKFDFIDKISVDMVSVDAEQSISEIRLKMNLTFF